MFYEIEFEILTQTPNKPHADWTYLLMKVRKSAANERVNERTNERKNDIIKAFV